MVLRTGRALPKMHCSGSGIALGVVCDISSADQIEAAVDKVISAYRRLDILVNNAFDSHALRDGSYQSSAPPASQLP
jgi:NAD(P)-dependent dehydrogenase (short-subunit alcohol dehydrogenase family)